MDAQKRYIASHNGLRGVAALLVVFDIVSVLSGLRCLAGFILGMLIFKYRRLPDSMSDGLLSILQSIAVAGIVTTLATASNDAYAIPCFALLVWVTWSDRGVIANPLSSRPLQFLGKISYSVYLNHYCLIQILFFFWSRLASNLIIFEPWQSRLLWICLLIAVVLAVLSFTFRWVEQPMRHVILARTKRRVSATS